MFDATHIALGYGAGHHRKTLINDVTFSLNAGEICAVIGHNGAGKSTLIRTMMGLQPPLSGHINWQGGQAMDAAYLGQRNNVDNQFPVRVKDVVAMGAWKDLGFWSSIDDAKASRIDMALRRTGLNHMAERPLYECSSGQLQRCFFARAIVQDAPLILLDEPFATIDQSTEEKLIDIIKGWRDEGRALMIVLHDLSAVMGISDTCLILGDGRASFGPTTDVLTNENLLNHHYLSQTQANWLKLLQDQKSAPTPQQGHNEQDHNERGHNERGHDV